MTIKGHIKGKDGIFAASLLVEMMCVTDQGLASILKDIYDKYGYMTMSEADFKFSIEKKTALQKLLFEEKKIPDFSLEVEKTSYMDGLKVYFKNGGWIIARFSGTEPLIRIFCEMPSMEQARKISDEMCAFLGL